MHSRCHPCCKFRDVLYSGKFPQLMLMLHMLQLLAHQEGSPSGMLLWGTSAGPRHPTTGLG